MGLFDRLFTDKKETKQVVAQEISSLRRVSPLCSSYENLFAQVRPLIDAMKVVRPYGVGRNGAKLDAGRTPELAILDAPNEQMGWAEFADLLFATWLTEREVNIHVWHEGKKVKGYTILPVGCRTRQATGENWYQVPTLNEGTKYLYDDEVMTLRYSRSPRNMDQGVSPATSVEVYAQIDDLMAQYQKAFIENGATPASITFITASTKERYDAKRNKMEHGLGGAKNKNKTLYVWKQMLDDGQSANEIEVKPIQGNNSTLAIKEIIDIVNDHLNKSVGVSNFILGDDSSAKYDNAELSNNQFITRRVYPALTAFWSEFQHELDRIVGGLGYGISFDLEIPELTERQQVRSDIKSKDSATLINLINAGADPIGAVEALGLSDSWKTVAIGISRRSKENLELQRLAQTASEPSEPTEMVSQSSVEPKGQENASTDELEHSCDCHHSNDARVATDYPDLMADADKLEYKLYDELHKLAEREILDRYPDLTNEEVEEAINDMLSGQANLGAADAAMNFAAAVEDKTIAGKINAVKDWNVSAEFQKSLEDRTHDIVGRYIEVCDDIKDEVTGQAKVEAWTANELEEKLAERIPRERAALIARNETVHSFRSAGIEQTKVLASKYDLKAYLVWNISDNGACDVCKAMDGKKVEAGKAFPDHATYTNDDGEEIQVGWEHTYFNDHGKEPNAHPNCRCYFTTEIEG